MEGSLDRIYVRNGSYFLGGWAFSETNSKRSTVDLKYSTGEGINFTRVARADCTNDLLVGFEIEANTTQLHALISQQFKIVAFDEHQEFELPVWRDLEIKCKQILIKNLLNKEDESVVGDILNLYLTKSLGSNGNTTTNTSSINATVGAQSIDENVIIGYNGRLFLFKGSNNLHSQYIGEPPEKLSEQWHSIIRDRATACESRGLQFLQLIIPEKQSVQQNDYPIKIHGTTHLLRELNQRLSDESCYVDLMPSLVKLENNDLPPFRNYDSHYSIHGIMKTIEMISDKLRLDLKFNPQSTSIMALRGDLGEKFFRNGGFVEECLIPHYSYITGAARKVDEVKVVNVDGHIGTQRSWINPNPISNSCLTVFGNSFCERGHDPLGLSFWLSRIFKEVHFYWTPEFSIETALANSSDIVLCQTVERFLKFKPNN